MSVHSTHYDESEEYERDLKWEYRREQWEQDHLDELINREQWEHDHIDELNNDDDEESCYGNQS